MTYPAPVINLIGANTREDIIRRTKNAPLSSLYKSLRICEEFPDSEHGTSKIPFGEIGKIVKDILKERSNYAQYCKGNWRTKPTVDLKQVTHIVEHGRGFSAYKFPDNEEHYFENWVCLVWEDPDNTKSSHETPAEYMERIFVAVHKPESFQHA